jgi:hypothetical protein
MLTQRFVYRASSRARVASYFRLCLFRWRKELKSVAEDILVSDTRSGTVSHAEFLELQIHGLSDLKLDWQDCSHA